MCVEDDAGQGSNKKGGNLKNTTSSQVKLESRAAAIAADYYQHRSDTIIDQLDLETVAKKCVAEVRAVAPK